MNGINVAEMKKELVDKLIASGAPKEEANRIASKEVESLGEEVSEAGELAGFLEEQ